MGDSTPRGGGAERVLMVILQMATERASVAVTLAAPNELAFERLLGAVSHHVSVSAGKLAYSLNMWPFLQAN